METTPTRPVLSVSQLTRQARDLLEDCFPAVWVEGEISGLSAPGSGHWYFTLKGENAQVGCAMFRRQNVRVRTPVTNGTRVLVRGKISLFEPRGQFQLIVEHLEDAGIGALQRAFEALKARLQAEGLFEPARKRSLPALPLHIGVVTSPTGAAIHDILTVLRRRFPAMRVTVFPTQVQGEAAPRQIVAAIERANRFAARLAPPLELLIVGRGGGSLEDLQAFNDEAVARAIAASALPVVSAVGHEVDVTIADFVADVRAPTPSAAAERVSPDGQEWLKSLRYRQQRLQRLCQQHLDRLRQQLDWSRKRLRHPGDALADRHTCLRLLQHRLWRAWQHCMHGRQSRLREAHWQLWAQSPAQRLQQQQQRLANARQRLQHGWQTQWRQHQHQLAHRASLLHSLSPMATLARGYAIVSHANGQILRKAKDSRPGDAITARLAEGRLHCTVDRIDPDHKE